MDGLEPSELENNSDEGFSYKDMIRRDERRWGIADTNGDHALDKVSPVFKIRLTLTSRLSQQFRRNSPTSCTQKMLLT